MGNDQSSFQEAEVVGHPFFFGVVSYLPWAQKAHMLRLNKAFHKELR